MMQISVNSVAYFFTKLQKYVGDFCLTELRKVECLMHVKNMNFSIFAITYDYILIEFRNVQENDLMALYKSTIYSKRIL